MKRNTIDFQWVLWTQWSYKVRPLSIFLNFSSLPRPSLRTINFNYNQMITIKISLFCVNNLLLRRVWFCYYSSERPSFVLINFIIFWIPSAQSFHIHLDNFNEFIFRGWQGQKIWLSGYCGRLFGILIMKHFSARYSGISFPAQFIWT